MKILRRGVDPKTVPIKATCANCKTEVEFTPDESMLSGDPREGNLYTIICPVCRLKIWASPNAPRKSNHCTAF